MAAIRASCLWFVALATACPLATVPNQAHAEAVAVRIPESASRTFPVLRSADDKDLAHGELIQTLWGDRVHSPARLPPRPAGRVLPVGGRHLHTALAPEGEDRFVIGGEPHKATRYLIKLELGGVTGVVASALGKAPSDLRYWSTAGPAPTFLRFEGAMFLNGPLWRIELGVPQWPR